MKGTMGGKSERMERDEERNAAVTLSEAYWKHAIPQVL